MGERLVEGDERKGQITCWWVMGDCITNRWKPLRISVYKLFPVNGLERREKTLKKRHFKNIEGIRQGGFGGGATPGLRDRPCRNVNLQSHGGAQQISTIVIGNKFQNQTSDKESRKPCGETAGSYGASRKQDGKKFQV